MKTLGGVAVDERRRRRRRRTTTTTTMATVVEKKETFKARDFRTARVVDSFLEIEAEGVEDSDVVVFRRGNDVVLSRGVRKVTELEDDAEVEATVFECESGEQGGVAMKKVCAIERVETAFEFARKAGVVSGEEQLTWIQNHMSFLVADVPATTMRDACRMCAAWKAVRLVVRLRLRGFVVLLVWAVVRGRRWI